LTRALGEHCIASSAAPPAALVLALAHADEPTYGQQEVAFSTHPSPHHGSLPRCIFAGTSPALVPASLRPGTRPSGAEKAMIWVRLLSSLRRHWPHTPLLVRGDRHGAPPEVIAVLTAYRWTDFLLGLAGHAVWLRQAAPPLQ